MSEMREILFRGKWVSNGKWIYGVPVSNDYITCIFKLIDGLSELKGFEVKPETVGQYTGLTDKNGVKIFEGDIVEHTTFHNEKIRTGFVEYSERYGAFFINGSGYSDNQMYAFCNFKVINNIHDGGIEL